MGDSQPQAAGHAATSGQPSGSRSRWWRNLLVFGGVGALVCLLAYGLIAQAPDRSLDQSLANGDAPAAPGFELEVLQRGELPALLARQLQPALADGRIDLEELRGMPVVLNFWASWCDPCREEAPLLARSWQRYGKAGVLFVGLDMQDDSTDARRFMADFDNTYLNVRDPTDATAQDWGVTGIPETFFITAQGKVVGHVIGVINAADVRAGAAAMRSGEPVGTLSGGAQRSTR